MPYPVDTAVPASLLHLLRLRVGARRGARLLHDHLDKPDDVVTEAELACAAGARIEIARDIGRPVPGGYSQEVSVRYSSMVGGKAWSGSSIAVPAIPDSMASGIVGRPIGDVVCDPHLSGTVVDTEMDEESTLIRVEDLMHPMGDVRPGWIVRHLADFRRWIRFRRLAKRLGYNHGFRVWTLPATLAGAFVACFAIALTVIAPTQFLVLNPIISPDAAGRVADWMLLALVPTTLVAALRFLVGMVDDETATKNHAKRTLEAVRRHGVSGKD